MIPYSIGSDTVVAGDPNMVPSIAIPGEQTPCEHRNIRHTYPKRKFLRFISRRIDTCKDCGKRLPGKWWIGAKTVKRKRRPGQEPGKRETV